MLNSHFSLFFFSQPYNQNDRRKLYAVFRRELHPVYFPKATVYGPGGVRRPQPANDGENAVGGLFHARAAVPSAGLLGFGLGASTSGGQRGRGRALR